MQKTLFHVYRNTPYGRETLLQAVDFVKKNKCKLHIYIPKFDRFLWHFDDNAVEIRLDKSYLYLPETAKQNVQSLLSEMNVIATFVKITNMTASNLPRLSTNFDLISLPRVMIERKGLLNLNALGVGVRSVIKNATVPVLISPGRFHNWQEILVMFGGSKYSIIALKWGLFLAQKSGIPLKVLTRTEPKKQRSYYEKMIQSNGIDNRDIEDWRFIELESTIALLDEVPREAFVIMGAYGHGRIKATLFGSTTELIQRNTSNLVMLIGEKCSKPKGI